MSGSCTLSLCFLPLPLYGLLVSKLEEDSIDYEHADWHTRNPLRTTSCLPWWQMGLVVSSFADLSQHHYASFICDSGSQGEEPLAHFHREVYWNMLHTKRWTYPLMQIRASLWPLKKLLGKPFLGEFCPSNLQLVFKESVMKSVNRPLWNGDISCTCLWKMKRKTHQGKQWLLDGHTGWLLPNLLEIVTSLLEKHVCTIFRNK